MFAKKMQEYVDVFNIGLWINWSTITRCHSSWMLLTARDNVVSVRAKKRNVRSLVRRGIIVDPSFVVELALSFCRVGVALLQQTHSKRATTTAAKNQTILGSGEQHYGESYFRFNKCESGVCSL